MANDQIRLVQDVPALYFGEATEFYRLNFLVGRTTSGAYSFTSTSSSVNYSGTGGEQGLYNALFAALQDYGCSAVDFNYVRSWIYGGDNLPMINGFRQSITRDSSGKIASYILWTTTGMTVKIGEQIITRDSTGKTYSIRKYVYSVDGTTPVADFTDTITRDSSGKLQYVDRTVTV